MVHIAKKGSCHARPAQPGDQGCDEGGDKPRLSTLRLMSAALKDRDIAARVDEKGQSTGRDKITDQEFASLLQKMIKQRRDSIDAFKQAGRTELADQEAAEITVIEEFLPKQMGDAEVERRHHRRHQGSRRRQPEGHGQGDGRPEGALRRPDGLRQGQRPSEGAAEVTVPPGTVIPAQAGIHATDRLHMSLRGCPPTRA